VRFSHDAFVFHKLENLMMMMMMESPVGTTYELRSHSLLPVGPRMTDKADSCGELSTENLHYLKLTNVTY